jgi:hypothetical protein
MNKIGETPRTDLVAPDSWRSIDDRQLDGGGTVELFWQKGTEEDGDKFKISVIDVKENNYFSFTMLSKAAATEAFKHPFYYSGQFGKVAIEGFDRPEQEAA